MKTIDKLAIAAEFVFARFCHEKRKYWNSGTPGYTPGGTSASIILNTAKRDRKTILRVP